jgi:hypothetical protein
VEGDLDIIVVYRYDLVPKIWPAGLRRIALVAEEVKLLVPDHYQPPAPRLEPQRHQPTTRACSEPLALN